MSEYWPDNWVVVKLLVNGVNKFVVLAGWSGGYLTGSSWRINSGIVSVEVVYDSDIHYYKFYGSSGSSYNCYPDSYGLRMNNAHIWEQLKAMPDKNAEIMDESTDWLKLLETVNES